MRRFLLCGETNYELSISQGNSTLPPVRTYGQTTAGGAITSSNSMLSVNNAQPTSTSVEISMATSTPVKLPKSPHRSESVASSWPGAKTLGESPLSGGQMSSSPGSSACITPENISEPKRLRSASVLDQVSPTVRMVIEVNVTHGIPMIKLKHNLILPTFLKQGGSYDMGYLIVDSYLVSKVLKDCHHFLLLVYNNL